MAKKVLIADDEPHILHVLAIKLRNAGYEVVTAMDGEEAMDLYLAERPDIIITDYQMPYVSGLDFCLQLKESNPTLGVPILMLSARGFDISSEQMERVGLQAVLAKPFSPREIVQKVGELLAVDPAQETSK